MLDKGAFKKSEKRMEKYLDLGHYRDRRYQRIAHFFEGKSGALLDIGCHKGALRGYLGPAIEYHGIDSSDNTFERYTKSDLNEKRLPYPEGTFAMINCSAVLEHLLYPYEILCEMARILADDGVCVISLPNDRGLNGVFGALFGRMPSFDESVYSHHWRFSIATAREFVEKKFRIIDEQPSYGPLYERYFPFLKLKALCTEWFMVCRKGTL